MNGDDFLTIREKVIKAVNDYVSENGYETWMSRREVVDYVNSCYTDNIKYSSLLPSDYCYNRYNIGLADFENKDRLFEYNDGSYRLLGEHYSFTGDVWRYPSDSDIEPYIVGRWEKGKFELYSNEVIENIKDEQSFKKEAVNIAERIEDDLNNHDIQGEERIALTKVRVNQSIYRRGLIRKYKHCCLCGVSSEDFLIASHIKPWSVSEADEKLDFDNGLLLCPNHDKLFDSGYLTFDNNGSIMISKNLGEVDKVFLNVNEEMKIYMNEKTKKYMKYHREHIYKG